MIRVDILASGSLANCNVIYDGTTAVVLDMGLEINKVRKYFLTKGHIEIFENICGGVISHNHQDHNRFYEEWCQKIGDKNIKLNDYSNWKSSFNIGYWHFEPFFVAHDVINVGYHILNKGIPVITWFTDASRLPEVNEKLTRESKIFLIEANHTTDQEQMYLSKKDNVRYYNAKRHLNSLETSQFVDKYANENTKYIHLLHVTTMNFGWSNNKVFPIANIERYVGSIVQSKINIKFPHIKLSYLGAKAHLKELGTTILLEDL